MLWCLKFNENNISWSIIQGKLVWKKGLNPVSKRKIFVRYDIYNCIWRCNTGRKKINGEGIFNSELNSTKHAVHTGPGSSIQTAEVVLVATETPFWKSSFETEVIFLSSFFETSPKKFSVSSVKKNFGMIFWKLHIPTNICLRSMIFTSNES